MPPLRIAFDMDGTLADLSSAYAEIEDQLYGAVQAEHERPAPELREVEQHGDGAVTPPPVLKTRREAERRSSPRTATRHRDRV